MATGMDIATKRKGLKIGRPKRTRALSLVESAVSIVLVGVVVVAALNTVGSTKSTEAKVTNGQQGMLAAEELLNEIMQKDYADQTSGANSFGLEVGENSGNRRYFDDVDDYDGLVEDPPKEPDGTDIDSLKNWRQIVDVSWVALNNLETPVGSNQGYKRIEVALYRNGVLVSKVVGIKSQGLPTLEACCKNAICEELSSVDCTAAGGSPKGKDTDCWTTDCTIADILFVVTNPAAPTSQEVLRCDLIKSWGFGVKLIDDAATKSAFDTALATVQAVFISLEADDVQVGTKANAATIGVVFEEPELGDEFGICSSYNNVDRSSMRLVNTTHYITSGFHSTTAVLFSSVQPVTIQRSGLALGATQLGSWQQSGSTYTASLIVVETGGLLNNLSLAPGRRVRLPWGRTGFDFSKLMPEGQVILYRSLIWAAKLEQQQGLGGLLDTLLN